MKKTSSLYEELKSILSNISGNDEIAEPYWENLDNDKRDMFDALCEKIDIEKRDISKCKRESRIYEKYGDLRILLNDFNKSFGDYPSFDFKKALCILYISEKIFSTSSTIPDENSSDSFSIFNVDLKLPSLAFATNIDNVDNNILWFKPSCEESLREIVKLDIDIEVWYALMSNLGKIDFSIDQEIVLCSRECCEENLQKNVISLLKLHMVSAGVKITEPPKYNTLPSNSSLEEFCPKLGYSQFDDVINVLGEYNNRSDVLSKYLSAYHVIENFMFKYPIVSLERSNDGKMFSIRDFKRLYNSVDISELKAIELLIKESFLLKIGHHKFQNFTFSLWEKFQDTYKNETKEINDFLEKLSLQKSSNVNKAGMAKFLAKLIYQVRCSIVHNKETEYHISTDNYSLGCSLTLERFLIPIIEEFIFLLLSKENNLVWYKTKYIKLWGEVT